jgi:hypothetical protein
MDTLYEQLERVEKSFVYNIVNSFFYAFIFLGFLLMMQGKLILAIILFAISAACFFGKKYLYVEYEYSFVNGIIEIDEIFEMKKRKKVLEFNAKDIELLAAENSDYIKDFSNKPTEIKSCFPKVSRKKVYIAMITGGKSRLQLRFVPDTEFLEHCRKYKPRAVKKEV